MYLLRWVRLMLSREFELQQVWLVWDAIFATSGADFALLEYICVAAVHLLRDSLLAERECTRVLVHLLRACGKTHKREMDVASILHVARQQQQVMALAAAAVAAQQQQEHEQQTSALAEAARDQPVGYMSSRQPSFGHGVMNM